MKLRTLLCSLAAMAVLLTACRKEPPTPPSSQPSPSIGFRSDGPDQMYRNWFSDHLVDVYGPDASRAETYLMPNWEKGHHWNDSTYVVPCRFVFPDTIGFSRLFFQYRNGQISMYNYSLIPAADQSLDLLPDDLSRFSGTLLSIDLVKGPMDWIVYRNGQVTHYARDESRSITFRDGETDPFIRPPEADGAGGGDPDNVRHYGNWCRAYHCDCCGNDGPTETWLTDWNVNYPGVNVHFNFPWSETLPWRDGGGGGFNPDPTLPPAPSGAWAPTDRVPIDIDGVDEAARLRKVRRLAGQMDLLPHGSLYNELLANEQLSALLSACVQTQSGALDQACARQLLFDHLLNRPGDLDELNDFITNAPPWFWPFISETLAEVVIELIHRQLGNAYNIPENFVDAIRAIQQKNLIEFISSVNDIAANFGVPFRVFDALWDLHELGYRAYNILEQLMIMSENIGPDPMTKVWMAMSKNANLLQDFQFENGDKALMIYGKEAEHFWMDLELFFRVPRTFPDGWGKGGEYFPTGNLYFIYYPFSTSGMGPTVEIRKCLNPGNCDGPPNNSNSVSLYKFRF